MQCYIRECYLFSVQYDLKEILKLNKVGRFEKFFEGS